MLKEPITFMRQASYLHRHGISVYVLAETNTDKLRIYINNNGKITPSKQIYTHATHTAKIEELVKLLYQKVKNKIKTESGKPETGN